MSKSIGNVVEPVGLVEEYGCDQVRYFMVNEVAFGSDGDFSDTQMVNCINAKVLPRHVPRCAGACTPRAPLPPNPSLLRLRAHAHLVTLCASQLANELGNLLYRTLSFAYKHCEQQIPTPAELTAEDEAMLSAAAGLLPPLRTVVGDLQLHRYTQTVSAVVQAGNQYIDVQAPWALRKTDPERMATVLWVLMESLRYVGLAYQPVTPSISSGILDQLGVPHDRRDFSYFSSDYALVGGDTLPKPSIIIPRYESAEEKAAAAAAPPKKGKKKQAAAA